MIVSLSQNINMKLLISMSLLNNASFLYRRFKRHVEGNDVIGRWCQYWQRRSVSLKLRKSVLFTYFSRHDVMPLINKWPIGHKCIPGNNVAIDKWYNSINADNIILCAIFIINCVMLRLFMKTVVLRQLLILAVTSADIIWCWYSYASSPKKYFVFNMTKIMVT